MRGRYAPLSRLLVVVLLALVVILLLGYCDAPGGL